MSAPKHISNKRTASEIAVRPYLEDFCASRGWNLELDYQVGPYFPDFAIPAQRLIIEVDGSSHNRHQRMAEDFRRNSYMRRHGWVTLRFTNQEVNAAPKSCIDVIAKFLRSNLILNG